jgi:hypothetical protein
MRAAKSNSELAMNLTEARALQPTGNGGLPKIIIGNDFATAICIARNIHEPGVATIILRFDLCLCRKCK